MPPEGNCDTADKESIVSKQERHQRWQKLSIEQLGIAINLFFTVGGALVAFAMKTMMDSKSPLPNPASKEFHWSLVILGSSVVSALIANVSRAFDFKFTRAATWHDLKGDSAAHDKANNAAGWCGTFTWVTFVAEVVLLGCGAALLCISLYTGYGSRI